MSTIITPRDLESIVGEMNLSCESKFCQPKPAVALVNVAHPCTRSYRKAVLVCIDHLEKLQRKEIQCMFCGFTLNANRVMRF